MPQYFMHASWKMECTFYLEMALENIWGTVFYKLKQLPPPGKVKKMKIEYVKF